MTNRGRGSVVRRLVNPRPIACLAAALFALAGCVGARGGSSPAASGAAQTSAPAPASDRLHAQARAALSRWAQAAAASGQHAFAVVGDPTAQVGDWEPSVGDNNKPALMAGLVELAGSLPAGPVGRGTVEWQDGTSETFDLLSAEQTIERIRAGATATCAECRPLQIKAARLTSGKVETSRGPATAPIWEFTIAGTAVRVTHVAVVDRSMVLPSAPPWDPNDPPIGLSIESASGRPGAREITVTFTGSPAPASRLCGADYSGEAVESSLAVVVIVVEHPNPIPVPCTAVGAQRTTTVKLAAPLGERAVLEVQEGRPVPFSLVP